MDTAHVPALQGRMTQGFGASSPSPTRHPRLAQPSSKRSWELGGDLRGTRTTENASCRLLFLGAHASTLPLRAPRARLHSEQLQQQALEGLPRGGRIPARREINWLLRGHGHVRRERPKVFSVQLYKPQASGSTVLAWQAPTPGTTMPFVAHATMPFVAPNAYAGHHDASTIRDERRRDDGAAPPSRRLCPAKRRVGQRRGTSAKKRAQSNLVWGLFQFVWQFLASFGLRCRVRKGCSAMQELGEGRGLALVRRRLPAYLGGPEIYTITKSSSSDYTITKSSKIKTNESPSSSAAAACALRRQQRLHHYEEFQDQDQ